MLGYYRLAATAVVVLLLASSIPVNAQSTALPGLGMNVGDSVRLQQEGVPTHYGSYWVGHWTSIHGWGGPENALKAAKANGLAPVIYWYYWGDSITPTCVEQGCDGRSKAQWQSMTLELAQRIRDIMGGTEVIVVLENEFNKGGITDDWYAPTFDAYLEARANELKAVPGVKIALGYGSWGENSWGKFPKAIAASDMIGFQLMRGQTRDTEASYRDAPDKIASVLRFVQTLSPGKNALLYDVALSSYPDAYWTNVQTETLKSILDRRAEYASNGLSGIIYRELRDNPSMGTHNWFGIAEQYWGFEDIYGARKPAYDVWRHAALNGAAAPAPAPSVPATFEGEAMTPTTGGRTSDSSASGGAVWNLWTNGELRQSVTAEGGDYRVSIVARGTPAGGVWPTMELRVNGSVASSWTVPTRTLTTYAADLKLPAGESRLAVAFTNDAWINPEDRNLYVDLLRVERTATNAAPVADFAATAQGLGLAVDASASRDADGDALTYAWSFGDGATATGVKATHQYAQAGTYTVSLTVSDGKLTSTSQRSVTATQPNRAPVASFDVSGANLSWSFDASKSTDADGDALTYAWSFGDGSTASGVRATHEYASAGSYMATLTVSDGISSATAQQTVTAAQPNRAPTASFSVSGANLSWSFDASASTDADGDALTYAWSFGDGRSGSGAQVAHEYAQAGAYQVTLTVRDPLAQTQTSKTVTATQPNRAPIASFEVAGSNLSWSFDARASSDADGDALTYAWSFGDGATAAGPTANHTYTAAGAYRVTLTLSDGKTSTTTHQTVTAVQPNRAPTASFSVSGAELAWTFNASASTDADGDALTYSWQFGNGKTATGPVVSVVYALPGDYAVNLTVSDGTASATARQTVSATQPNRAPVASFNVSGANLSWSFDASKSSDADGDTLSYEWDFGNGKEATGRFANMTYSAAGVYNVTLTVSDGQANASVRQTVTAVQPNRAPTASFSVSGANLSWSFDASASSDPDADALSYAWDFGNGQKATGPLASVKYATPGDYTVRLAVSDGRGGSNETTRLVKAVAPNGTRSMQAEHFASKDNGMAFADSMAEGGAAWLLWSNGAMRHAFQPGEGTFQVNIVAKGDWAQAWPIMELRADGALVAIWSVDSASWRTYSTSVKFAAGESKTLSVHFTNDYWVNGADRNLRVDAVHLVPAKRSSMMVEAEAFASKPVGGKLTDKAASGGQGWNIWSNGAISHSATLAPGNWSVEVVAKGAYALGWPIMELRADGKLLGRWVVGSSTWHVYQANLSVPTDQTLTLSVHFTNDFWQNGQDRNLHADLVRIVPTP